MKEAFHILFVRKTRRSRVPSGCRRGKRRSCPRNQAQLWTKCLPSFNSVQFVVVVVVFALKHLDCLYLLACLRLLGAATRETRKS